MIAKTRASAAAPIYCPCPYSSTMGPLVFHLFRVHYEYARRVRDILAWRSLRLWTRSLRSNRLKQRAKVGFVRDVVRWHLLDCRERLGRHRCDAIQVELEVDFHAGFQVVDAFRPAQQFASVPS